MKFKFWIPNIFLCIVILVLVIENLDTWTQSFDSPEMASTAPAKSFSNNEISAMPSSAEEPSSIRSYHVISERNIFSPERRDFPAPVPIAGASKPAGRPQIVLHGVAIAGDYQSATVSNPGQPLQKGQRETRTLKIGGKIGEYQLARILPDRIAMESGGDTFEVLLDDRNKPKRRVEVKTDVQPAPGMEPAQPTPEVPSKAAPAQAESMEKAGQPAKERVITQAAPIPNKDILISRSTQSASNRLRQSFIGASNKPNTEMSGSTN